MEKTEENDKCKLELKSTSKPGRPFGIHSLNNFREVGNYTWIAREITDEMGFPNCVKDTDDCHYCEGQLFVMRHGAEETSQSTDSFGQVLTIINHETRATNIFTRAVHPLDSDEWTPWQMVATGDPKLITENNDINKVLSTLRQQIENDSKRIETAENSLLASATVRFDRIEENETTINVGEVDVLKEVIYYKPANKFVAADSAGNYWDTWDGMEAYMSDGKIREDKVYLCGGYTYVYDRISLISSEEANTDNLKREVCLINSGNYVYTSFQYGSIKTAGNVGDIILLTPETSTSYMYIIADCKEGDIFYYTGTGGFNPRAYAFIDSNNTLIMVAPEGWGTKTEKEFTAPLGSAKAIFNFATSAPYNLKQENKNNLINHEKRIAENKVLVDELDYKLSGVIPFVDGYNIDLSVGIGSVVNIVPEKVSNYRYAVVPAKGGDSFTIAGIGGISPRLWGFIDENNVLLSVAAEGSEYNGSIVTAPVNTSYLILNDKNSGRVCFKHESIESEIERLGDELSIVEYSDSPFVLKHLYNGNLIENNKKNASFAHYVFALAGSTINVDNGYMYQYAIYNISSGLLEKQYKWKTEPTILDKDCLIRLEVSTINEVVLADVSIKEHLHYKLYAKKYTVKESLSKLKGSVYQESLEMSEQANNILNLIGVDNFVGKIIEIAKPYKYSSWPMCGSVNGNLACVYTIGNSHTDNHNSDVYVKLSSNGIVWSAKNSIISTPLQRDGVTGKGNDSNGNMLILNRIGPPDSPNTYFVVYKSTDGLKWNVISKPIFEIVVGHAGDIISVPSVGLVSFYNTYGDSRTWGLLISSDNGETWTQRNVETNLTQYECPSEMSAIYLGEGKILALGRLEKSDTEHTTMYQMQSSDYGTTWTRFHTNIEGVQNTPSLLYDENKGIVTMYVMDRQNGELRKYTVSKDSVWDNPTSWPMHDVISSGWAKGENVGNVNAVRFNGNDIVSFYSGSSTLSGIYAVIQ